MGWFVGRSSGRRLTDGEVRGIRREYASGQTQAQIARDYGVSPSTVSDIVNRRTHA